jgi:hypothetical protein
MAFHTKSEIAVLSEDLLLYLLVETLILVVKGDEIELELGEINPLLIFVGLECVVLAVKDVTRSIVCHAQTDISSTLDFLGCFCFFTCLGRFNICI